MGQILETKFGEKGFCNHLFIVLYFTIGTINSLHQYFVLCFTEAVSDHTASTPRLMDFKTLCLKCLMDKFI